MRQLGKGISDKHDSVRRNSLLVLLAERFPTLYRELLFSINTVVASNKAADSLDNPTLS